MAVPTAKLLLALAVFQAPVRQSQTGIVTGILRTNTGVVLEGLRVAVEPIENPLGAEVLESIGLTDKAGRYVLENVSPGRYRILVGRLGSILYHPGFPERERATTVAVVAGQTTEVADMVFHRTMVSGRVVDLKTGQTPRIDSLTLCCLLDFVASPSPIVRMAKVEALKSTVDDSGGFTFVEVPPGAYALQTVGPGLVSAAHPISVGNEDVSGLEVRVSAGVEVRGRVMDRLKVPVTSVNLTLKPDSTNGTFELINGPMMDGAFIGASLDPSVLNAMPTVRDRIPKPRPVPVTAEGTFSFAGVLPGKYRLEMSAPGGNSFVREIEVGAREPVDASLDLPFTQVTGQIVALDGSPLPSLTGSVRFVASDPDSRILFGFPDDFGRFSVLMTAGEYHLFTDTLNIDRYIQSISDGSRDLQTHRFVVDGLQRQEIRIAIAR